MSSSIELLDFDDISQISTVSSKGYGESDEVQLEMALHNNRVAEKIFKLIIGIASAKQNFYLASLSNEKNKFLSQINFLAIEKSKLVGSFVN